MKLQQALNEKLFDTEHTAAAGLFASVRYPWEVLPLIRDFIMDYGSYLDEQRTDEYIKRGDSIWIHKTAVIYDSAYIAGPCIIGARSEVRHSAFIRGSVFVGDDCVVGNSTELKNVILFDHVEVPHYNYVGDSILGYCSHMGAGSITSNIKSDRKNILIHFDDGDYESGMRKIGAFLGDYAEIGCGTVLNPGTIIGRNSSIYPLSSVRGCVDPESVYKKHGEVAEKY